MPFKFQLEFYLKAEKIAMEINRACRPRTRSSVRASYRLGSIASNSKTVTIWHSPTKIGLDSFITSCGNNRGGNVCGMVKFYILCLGQVSRFIILKSLLDVFHLKSQIERKFANAFKTTERRVRILVASISYLGSILVRSYSLIAEFPKF